MSADGRFPVRQIEATGTRNEVTYLRGDGTWATPAGGGGPGSDHYEHTQVGAAAEWTIVHNLGRYPSVVLILDSDPGEAVYTDTFHDDLNTTRIVLPSPESGEAHLN